MNALFHPDETTRRGHLNRFAPSLAGINRGTCSAGGKARDRMQQQDFLRRKWLLKLQFSGRQRARSE